MEMEKKFDPVVKEQPIRDMWADKNVYWFDKETSKEVFSIDTPPPTVSWSLHMWHIWSYTHTDVVARIKRMLWYEVFYPMGFDDNWLPTERLVEKELWDELYQLDTDHYVEKCMSLVAKYREQYKNIRQQLWLSVDWQLSYSTISDVVKRISQKSFLELYERWLIYKTMAPALWCPETQTTISQADLEDVEMPSAYHELTFSLSDGAHLPIATTRPELLPSCVAVFVHPDDERYNGLIGQDIVTPLWAIVKILWDSQVKIDKWTWVVMCCTYWDELDLYRVKKYWLPEKIIVSKDGKIDNSWVEYLDGNSVEKARRIIVEKLKEEWTLTHSTSITHSVKVHDRTWKPVELLPLEQWFINIMDYKTELLDMADQIQRHPENMKKRYIDRVNNLQRDWNISRNRKYGIPFPLWVSEKDQSIITADKNDLPVDPRIEQPHTVWDNQDMWDFKPVDFVLDTWATSSSSVDIIKKYWEPDDMSDKVWTISYRAQAHDIIRTRWFYSVVKSLFEHQTIPFENIAISGHVLWKGKTKLSKSKGSKEKWPEAYLAEYWADAIRYRASWWFLGKDIILDQDEILQGKKLINKLWNSVRFVDMQLRDYEHKEIAFADLYDVDRWILTKLQDIKQKMYALNSDFNIAEARNFLVRFFRDDFCSLYLEMVKDVIYKPEMFVDWNKRKISSQYTLKKSIQELVKLFAPYLPYVTEELYQNDSIFTNKESDSIHCSAYPLVDDACFDKELSDESLNIVFAVIQSIRAYKSSKALSIGASLEEVTIQVRQQDKYILDGFLENIKSIANAKCVTVVVWEDWLLNKDKFALSVV